MTRSEPHGKTARPWDPERSQPEAQSPAAKLPEGDGGFFLLAPVRRVDVRRFDAPDEQDTRGAPPFAPAMRVCLWLSAYGVGGVASRKRAWAGARPLACLAIGGQERPDCRTSSDVRPRPLEALLAGCVQGGRVAGEAGLGPWGNVSPDGTKRPGNASRPNARRSGALQQHVER